MVATRADAFAALQRKLAPALAANRPGSATPHVLIALASYSASESMPPRDVNRIMSLEHRDLTAIAVAGRIETCDVIHVSTVKPPPEVFDYHLALLPQRVRDDVRTRVGFVEVDDGTTRSVAARLLEMPERIGAIRTHIGDRPAFIEPWSVGEAEVNLALALGVPINGTAPELRPLAFRSAGRRLFKDVGVPVPLGREDVRTTDDVVDAVRWIARDRPLLGAVVIKHDDGSAGHGNVVLDLRAMHHADDPDAWVRDAVESLPDSYRSELLRQGGVVEERVTGSPFSSPSAQVDIRPGGEVIVLGTHEQVLGEDGQVALGSRFPADPAYAAVLADDAAKVGAKLAAEGCLGRFAVDFVAADSDVDAIEINLRKGSATHPYAALRNLVPGRYDATAGTWIAEDGSSRCYVASDNLVHESWLGLEPADVIDWVARAGLQFDPVAKVGTVLHMLSGLAIDGRFGATVIASTLEQAVAMEHALKATVQRLADRRRTDREPSPTWPEMSADA